MSNEIQNITDVLDLPKDCKTFTIPLYQRQYAWQADEVETLIDDIKKATNRHYIGNIVIDSNNNVIDGQQRLTTLYLLLCVLEKGNEYFKLNYQIRKEDDEFLKELKTNSKIELEKCTNVNMRENLQVMRSKKDKFNDKIAEAFLKKINFTITKLSPDTDITKYFELINSRGLQLEKHHILKAKFLEVFKDEKDIDWAKIWEYCSSMDTFLEDVISYKNKKITYRTIRGEFEKFIKSGQIPSYFENEENNDTENKNQLEPTILNLLKPLDKNDTKSNEETVKAQKEYKSIVGFDFFLLNILQYFYKKEIKQSDEEKISMNNLKLLETFDSIFLEKEQKKYQKEDAKNFMLLLLKCRIIFDYFIFKRDVADSEKPYLRNVETDCIFKMDNQKELINIELLFNVSNSKAQDWICDVFGLIDDNLEYIKSFNFIEKLEKLDIKKAKERYLSEKDKEKEKCFLNQGTGTPHYWFYRLEYLLWKKYDKYFNFEHLTLPENLKDEYKISKLNSIEHIQPRSKQNGWDKNIDNFGNLALISSHMNSKLLNHNYKDKKADLQKQINNGTFESLKMILVYWTYDEWNLANSQKHQKEMLELLFKDIIK